ncbi:diguanylate cyclase [Zoogloea sp.]|uniref:diguanylate cyclase domain-containing protein n=1 Tax=Zoogloea sp. TaxID=49181 RepID=UPI0031FC38D7
MFRLVAPSIGSTPRIVAAIIMFVVFDLVALLSNLWIAEQVAQDAVAINLAGRQRMLSQQTTKALLLATRPGINESPEHARREIVTAFTLFEQTLRAFDEGGEATGGDGHRVALRAVSGEASRIVRRARGLVAPLTALLHDERGHLPNGLEPAADYLVQHNAAILDLMNQLTTVLEQDSIRRTRDLRTIQSSAFLLALVNFMVLVLGMIRRHRAAEEAGQLWRNQARQDPLTGIANRKAFEEGAEALLMRARQDNGSGALLLLDLDGFKPINDRFGHSAGDDILKAVAGALTAAARGTDLVARLGGDEFIVLCPRAYKEVDIDPLCERLVNAISTLPTADLPGCRLGVSIGVATYPDCGYSLNGLLSRADKAMYVAKGAGGSRWQQAA